MTDTYELSIAFLLSGKWNLILRCENRLIAECMTEYYASRNLSAWIKVERILG